MSRFMPDNRPDAPAGTPLYTATCRALASGRSCWQEYTYAAEHDRIPNEPGPMAAAMSDHLNAHTGWTAALRADASGIDVWCPEHRDRPEALAAELRRVADEAARTLTGGDALDRLIPGTPTHATVLAAHAHALAGLATLTGDRATAAVTKAYAAGLLSEHEARARLREAHR